MRVAILVVERAIRSVRPRPCQYLDLGLLIVMMMMRITMMMMMMGFHSYYLTGSDRCLLLTTNFSRFQP